MTDYLLGHTDTEHARLIRQATRLAPVTEEFFREAGIRPGQHVLDLGSGVGDVAMLAARIVGPSGRVTGIERDRGSIAFARQRAKEAGLDNVTFIESDIARFSSDVSFDAAVGRFILQFLPDAEETLRAVAGAVRPGGVVAFQEMSWAPFALLSERVPFWSTAVSVLHDVSVRAGVRMEMGVELYQAFRAAGLPAPQMRLVMELGADPDFTRWLSDSIVSAGASSPALGNPDTLRDRLQQAVAAANTVVPWLALVNAWCRTR